MGIGEKIYTDSHITGFKEEIAKAAQQPDDQFFTWFNSAANRDAAFVRGQWDFALHIAQAASLHLLQTTRQPDARCAVAQVR